MNANDTYNIIQFPVEKILFKEKGSKFLGFAYPIVSEENAKTLIEQLKKKHYSAHHCCYAYQIGTRSKYFRTFDDGEPKNTAGTPIYGQIQSFDLTNILVVVIRYFGGTKLGVGGLIKAYKTCAIQTLNTTVVVKKTIDVIYTIAFDYKNINKIMRIIKEKNIQILTQKMELNCEIQIAVRQKNSLEMYNFFNDLHEISIKPNN